MTSKLERDLEYYKQSLEEHQISLERNKRFLEESQKFLDNFQAIKKKKCVQNQVAVVVNAETQEIEELPQVTEELEPLTEVELLPEETLVSELISYEKIDLDNPKWFEYFDIENPNEISLNSLYFIANKIRQEYESYPNTEGELLLHDRMLAEGVEFIKDRERKRQGKPDWMELLKLDPGTFSFSDAIAARKKLIDEYTEKSLDTTSIHEAFSKVKPWLFAHRRI